MSYVTLLPTLSHQSLVHIHQSEITVKVRNYHATWFLVMWIHVVLEDGIIPGLYWPMFVCILTENMRYVQTSIDIKKMWQYKFYFEHSRLLGYGAVSLDEWFPVFWRYHIPSKYLEPLTQQYSIMYQKTWILRKTLWEPQCWQISLSFKCCFLRL
jgi:hypothetical protein